jgi:dTDP-4-dehydrorhamnose 3,5-epimerase-like enzyme
MITIYMMMTCDDEFDKLDDRGFSVEYIIQDEADLNTNSGNFVTMQMVTNINEILRGNHAQHIL